MRDYESISEIYNTDSDTNCTNLLCIKHTSRNRITIGGQNSGPKTSTTQTSPTCFSLRYPIKYPLVVEKMNLQNTSKVTTNETNAVRTTKKKKNTVPVSINSKGKMK